VRCGRDYQSFAVHLTSQSAICNHAITRLKPSEGRRHVCAKARLRRSSPPHVAPGVTIPSPGHAAQHSPRRVGESRRRGGHSVPNSPTVTVSPPASLPCDAEPTRHQDGPSKTTGACSYSSARRFVFQRHRTTVDAQPHQSYANAILLPKVRRSTALLPNLISSPHNDFSVLQQRSPDDVWAVQMYSKGCWCVLSAALPGRLQGAGRHSVYPWIRARRNSTDSCQNASFTSDIRREMAL
jgi:hypothetical protein